jgi:hypothetical protein
MHKDSPFIQEIGHILHSHLTRLPVMIAITQAKPRNPSVKTNRYIIELPCPFNDNIQGKKKNGFISTIAQNRLCSSGNFISINQKENPSVKVEP